MNSQRRRLVLAAAGAWAGQSAAFPICTGAIDQVCNITRLYSVETAGIVAVNEVADIRRVLNSPADKISIGGGRYSMGGQTATKDGIQLDMRPFNQLVWLDIQQKTVRVQAGMRWRDLQTLLDPYDLSVRTMQSYANFTVGGSVSVNCHGRYVGHGAIAGSVRAVQLALPEGQVIEANRLQETALFEAAIGGYGAVGVLTEIELDLDDNCKLARSTARVPLLDYPDWFQNQLRFNTEAVLHNADLIPPSFDQPFCVTWSRTQDELTVTNRLTPVDQIYRREPLMLWALTELPSNGRLRAALQQRQQSPMVVWRNHEASLDVRELEPTTRRISTYVLQEYFVPTRHFRTYAPQLAKLLSTLPAHAVNVSIRHSNPNTDCLLAWAHEEVFCFVIYCKQRMWSATEPEVSRWTRALIDLALQYEGTYYLPYQPHATQAQFEQAYPQINVLRRLRHELGAQRLTNSLWERYGV